MRFLPPLLCLTLCLPFAACHQGDRSAPAEQSLGDVSNDDAVIAGLLARHMRRHRPIDPRDVKAQALCDLVRGGAAGGPLRLTIGPLYAMAVAGAIMPVVTFDPSRRATVLPDVIRVATRFDAEHGEFGRFVQHKVDAVVLRTLDEISPRMADADRTAVQHAVALAILAQPPRF